MYGCNLQTAKRKESIIERTKKFIIRREKKIRKYNQSCASAA